MKARVSLYRGPSRIPIFLPSSRLPVLTIMWEKPRRVLAALATASTFVLCIETRRADAAARIRPVWLLPLHSPRRKLTTSQTGT